MDAVERLAQLIEEHASDVSSRELARRSGGAVTSQTFNNIRNGSATKVQRRTVDAIAAALRLPRTEVYVAAGMQMEPVRLPPSADELDEARRARLVAMALDLVEEQRRETGL